MYKTILLSGALLVGGLCLSCNSTPQTGEQNMTKTNNVPGQQSMGTETPHPDIPPTMLPEHKGTAEQEKKIAKLVTALSEMKMPELYGKYIDLNTLEVLDYNALLERLKGIQIIYVAEQHTNETHHKLQEDLLKSLFQKNPKAVLAMEFLYRSKQQVCDDYISGKITEEEFDSQAKGGFGEWYTRYYLNLIRTAKKNSIKLLALNVEREIKRKMAKEGWDKLTPEEQKLIARDIDSSNKAHREFVMKQFEGMMNNPQTKEMFNGPMGDRMYLLQCMWDETFGESLANYLKAANDPAAQIVVVLGSGHISYKFTAPDRSYKRYPASFKTLVPFEITENTPADKKAYFNEILESGIGDFVYFSPLSPREENPELPFGRRQ